MSTHSPGVREVEEFTLEALFHIFKLVPHEKISQPSHENAGVTNSSRAHAMRPYCGSHTSAVNHQLTTNN
ncbi:MAG: hypothetical protein QNJ63_28745 [Calothrix sp. MO_192.B10]|nr:hypothetical protein [Calothrix sp. MO_192.B10]